MRDGKKKVWICLLVVVLAAVVAGLLYWLSTPRAPSTEGFLIRNTGNAFPVSTVSPGQSQCSHEQSRRSIGQSQHSRTPIIIEETTSETAAGTTISETAAGTTTAETASPRGGSAA